MDTVSGDFSMEWLQCIDGKLFSPSVPKSSLDEVTGRQGCTPSGIVSDKGC